MQGEDGGGTFGRAVRTAGGDAVPPLSQPGRRLALGGHARRAGRQRWRATVTPARQLFQERSVLRSADERCAAQYRSTCLPWPCFSLAIRSRRCRRREAT